MAEKGGVSYEFGHFRLDIEEGQLLRDGRQVPLTPKVFETLVLLVERAGRLVRKDELMQALWPDSFVEEANLSNNIWTLRTALGDSRDDKYIETVPKRGYRFVAEVHSINAQGNADVGDKYEAPLNQIKQHKSSLILLAAIVVVTAVGIIVWYRAAARFKPAINAIAVLPFVNVSNNPDTEYLSDGVTESLINNLAQLPNLKVIANTSSFSYKGKEIDLEKVSKALDVEAVLMGRITQRGDDILINVELIDARDKTQIWGEQYKHKTADLLELQSNISREIVQNLRLRLTTGQVQQLAKKETVKPDAYELYLKGRFHWSKSGTDNQRKAIEYYQRAIALDPSYAHAYAEMSFAYNYLIVTGDLNAKEFTHEAEAAAAKALELDETVAEAHLALGDLKDTKWDWPGAEREFKRAIELSPNVARSHERYSFYLSLMGRHDEAIAEVTRARELDPLSPSVNLSLAYRLSLARQYDKALEALTKTLELNPNYPDAYNHKGYVYAAKGQYREAIAAHEQSIKLGDKSPDTQVYLGAALAKAGERDRALRILKQLQANANTSPGTLATLYLALDEREQALASLERAYNTHDAQLQFLAVDPNLAVLKSQPRFQQLMRQVGLSQ